MNENSLSKLVAIVTLPDGDEYGIELGSLNVLQHQVTQMGILFGASIGASVILSVLLTLVARTYRSLLFVLYQTNLALLTLVSVLEIVYLESFSRSPAQAILMSTVTLSTRDNAVSVCCTLFYTLLIYSVLATFIVQIHTAFSDCQVRTKLCVTLVTCIAAFPCIFIYTWRVVIAGLFAFDPSRAAVDEVGNVVSYTWVYNGMWPSFAATVAVFSGVLCAKLWFTCQKRARLGIEHMDPVKVIFVMSSENSVISAALLIVTAATTGSVQTLFGASAIPFTACVLPVGYIWAQVQQLKGQIAAGNVTSMAAQQAIRTHGSFSEYPEFPSPISPDSPTSGTARSDLRDYLEKMEKDYRQVTTISSRTT